MQDTIQIITGGGFEDLSWSTMWVNYVEFFILGLLSALTYFWLVIRNGNDNADTFKEFFAVKKNQNDAILHLILYIGVVLVWILEGGVVIPMLILEPVRGMFGLVNIDITQQIGAVYGSFRSWMPQGKLNWFAIILGGGMTFFVRMVLPRISEFLKGVWGKFTGLFLKN
jgi:hypothetical protein